MIKDIDKGWNRIKGEVQKMKNAHARIGILQGAPAYPDGTTQAEAAFWNEFGTEDIPERSFVRSTADEKRATYGQVMKKETDKIMLGTSNVKTSLERAGMLAQGHVRKKIKTLKSPPNAPSTIAKKSSSNPLIDTGTMLRAVDYEVKM
ncbi:hypothetical protein ACFSC6_12255 [Rufibacter sediminis]|uniref:Uncharacterized protein n=1 Tax=Rufibacter sediminis TaxID=2762756 RepID=A0ABR6VU31_9BACT|nr:hypothetical protein [Rufibacter sediminis]MBC3540655.1 hypothetical protein [Rufibacter sediminis]